jgi:hypothetical protein
LKEELEKKQVLHIIRRSESQKNFRIFQKKSEFLKNPASDSKKAVLENGRSNILPATE